MHSTFSDGKAAPEEYIAPALAADIKEIGFSEHLSLINIKQEWCMNPSEVGSYIKHIGNLKIINPDIIVRTGLEIDYLPGKEKVIEMFLSELDLDYRIGSVHYLGEKTVDLDPGFYENKNFDLLFENYFTTVIAAAASGLFDIIAHCDLIRIYGHRPSFDP
ncbi:MAG: hypothetical protein JXN62_14325, partial [Bacteroidales bacterium]|nr:hypothetical protein [Bacteroidales bacterium]